MTSHASTIHLVENHDAAYGIWKQAAVRDRILVHIDAHHDMWWVDDPRFLSIANYICPALAEGIVREIFWVVPDKTFATAAGRAAVRRHVQKIVETYPNGPAPIESIAQGLRTTVMGRTLVVCSLEALPPIAEPVVLDIDTDYLILSRVTYGRRQVPPALPWRWPAELVALLGARNLRAAVTTIAYSVTGGYTPIGWKYLGFELACRLSTAGGATEAHATSLAACDDMQRAVLAEGRGDVATAEEAYRRAAPELGAASHFRMAYLRLRQGKVADGRDFLERALRADASYRAPYVTPGIPLYVARDYPAAERAFRDAVRLDPADACAHVGLGWIAARRHRWVEAESHARAALGIDPSLIDAHRGLSIALEKQGNIEEAIRACEQSLKLALAGQRSFSDVTAASPDGVPVADSDHARTHARLGRLWERAGDASRAIAGYRIAIAGGYNEPALRARLARLETAAR